MISYIIHKDDSNRTSIVLLACLSEPVLACSVPNLNPDCLLKMLDVLHFVINSCSTYEVLVEFSVRIPHQQARLANASVS